jgi:hypothetical protein
MQEPQAKPLRNAYRAGSESWVKNRPLGFLLIGVMILVASLARHQLSSSLIGFAVCTTVALLLRKFRGAI